MKTYNYFLGIGSNIEPRISYMQQAVDQLKKYGVVIHKSSLYESEPWGNKNQARFYNAVIEFASEIPPGKLLTKIKKIERHLGREKSARWGPRRIDIDILLCDDMTIAQINLLVPHVRLTGRKFVLQPLSEITHEIMVGGINYNTQVLVQECKDNSMVNKLIRNW